MALNDIFNGVYHIVYGLYLILHALLTWLVYACVILCLLHLSGIITFSRSDYKVQTEECLKLGGKEVEEVDQLPLKDKTTMLDRDYESTMLKLKEMAPRNGRAVELCRKKVFGPYVSKLEAWN